MPWPEVQPPPRRVPKPTRRPAAMIMTQLAGICGDGMAYPTQLAVSGARMSPAIKALRQALSFIPKPRQPPNMPLMPAIRPVNSINNAAERPISAPPIAAETGVKLAMILPRDAARSYRICDYDSAWQLTFTCDHNFRWPLPSKAFGCRQVPLSHLMRRRLSSLTCVNCIRKWACTTSHAVKPFTAEEKAWFDRASRVF